MVAASIASRICQRGAYTVSLSGPGATAAPQQAWVSGTALSVATIDFVLGPDAGQFFQPVAPPSDGSLYFLETGHTLGGAFRSYWQSNGGLPIIGYPISQEFIERGEDGRDYVVQYFERHRLEQHTENQPPYHILLSRLGNTVLAQSGRDWFAFPKGQPQPGCLFFEATGHSLCEPFLELLARARAGVRRAARHQRGREPGAVRPGALRATGRDLQRWPALCDAVVRARALRGPRRPGRAARPAGERAGDGARLATLAPVVLSSRNSVTRRPTPVRSVAGVGRLTLPLWEGISYKQPKRDMFSIVLHWRTCAKAISAR